MYFHRPGRAGGNAETAGDAFLIIEYHQPGFRVDPESAGRAHGNAGAAMGAPFLVARHILAQRLYFHAGFYQELDSFIVLRLVSL
jgi:hypothetical protein